VRVEVDTHYSVHHHACCCAGAGGAVKTVWKKKEQLALTPSSAELNVVSMSLRL